MYKYSLNDDSGEILCELGCRKDDLNKEFWQEILKEYNVYDIRRLFGLYYIIEEKSVCCHSSIAIFINLYYDEDVEAYCKYINSIPKYIDVYVFSSKPIVLEKVKMYINDSERSIALIQKENRGRDISALLVAGRKFALKYKYICFVHDKKSLQFENENWSKSFAYNMWENTLKNGNYINGVLDIFENEERLGVLSIPEPIHGCYFSYLGRMWGGDFEITEALCQKLNIKVPLCRDKQPITLGTAFWCRTEAIKDILECEFKYEDFPEEPMPNDGTISHAIERIWAYAAQNRGYYTGTLMNKEYAAIRMAALQELVVCELAVAREHCKCDMPDEILNFKSHSTKIKEFCSKYNKIYIYGAGKIGKRCASELLSYGVGYDGFVVSDEKIDSEKQDNCRSLTQIIENERLSIGIIVAVGNKFRDEVIDNLKKVNFVSYMMY